MPDDDALLEVGRIDRAHGLRGEVIVTLRTNATERVAPGAHLVADGREVVVRRSSPHQHRWRVQLDGVESREDADLLAGAVLRAEPIDDPDATWFHDLIGKVATLPDGTAAGTVVAIQDNPAADLLVLDGGALVPMVFVGELDGDRVAIDPPPGLLEL